MFRDEYVPPVERERLAQEFLTVGLLHEHNYILSLLDNSSNEGSHTTTVGLKQELHNRVKHILLKLSNNNNM